MKRSPKRQARLPHEPPSDYRVSAQLARLHRHLALRHKNLVGIGVGSRTRDGKNTPEVVVRFVVRKRLRHGRLPHGESALPSAVPVWTQVLGQSVCVMVPTDVREPTRMKPTSFGIDGGQATSLATWPGTDGSRKLGVITAGHCLPPVGQTVRVMTLSGETLGTVVARSEYLRDGIDVGLARLDCPPEDIADVAPASAPSISIEGLVGLLGTDRADAMRSPMTFWNEVVSGDLLGLAYYWLYSSTNSGRSFTMRDVIEVAGPEGAFTRGLSGSPLAITLPSGESRIAAVQSMSSSDESHCIATHFRTALTWLCSSRRELAQLAPFWSMADLPG